MLNEHPGDRSGMTTTTKTVRPAAKKTAKKATAKKAVKKVAKKATKKAAAKKAAKKVKKAGNILLPIRMSIEADKLLRTSAKAYQIGNLTKRVLAAIQGVDLTKVKVEDRPRTPHAGKDYAITTINLPQEIKASLSIIADARGTSMSALIDGAVKKFYQE